MSASVTSQYLMEGAVYSLEQCGLLLCDDVLLYQNGSYASALVLTAFAREELGRWKILLALRKDTLSDKAVTLPKIKTLCGDHVKKQRAGMLSVTIIEDRDSGVGKLIRSRQLAVPGSEESRTTEDVLNKIHEQKKKRMPQDRHDQRQLALYVDPVSTDKWSRPSREVSKSAVRDFLQDARNDYAIQSSCYYQPMYLRESDPEFCKALEEWADRPELPNPEVVQ